MAHATAAQIIAAAAAAKAAAKLVHDDIATPHSGNTTPARIADALAKDAAWYASMDLPHGAVNASAITAAGNALWQAYQAEMASDAGSVAHIVAEHDWQVWQSECHRQLIDSTHQHS